MQTKYQIIIKNQKIQNNSYAQNTDPPDRAPNKNTHPLLMGLTTNLQYNYPGPCLPELHTPEITLITITSMLV